MSDDPQGIAIIGMAGRFPGARNVAEFWRNLVAGRETIEQLSDDQLKAAGLDPATLRAQENYVPARGVLDRPEWFDAGFFGLTPKEAEVIDPQQRVFLEEAWTALEDAGIDPARSPGPIGVFAGMSNNTYWANNVSTRPDLIENVGWLNAMMGNEKDYLATRVAYKFDLRGPAISLYTACSTSLVAVCQACTSLLNFQCDAALAGGVSITFPQERGYEFHEGGITSPDGHCRAFDVKAAGTVFSHGIGVVVLKRLADALAAGDQIYAVIKGHALNNDGASKVSFTAPSVDGHAEVIALAQGFAGFSPDSISYVEAHGTATPLGDPIEIAGLTQAFRAETERRGFCAIGSVKTNIGHLDAAAGVAGLIKTALALKHRTLPASLHFTAPNPQLELESSPFFVNTALREWPAEAAPRRAGVSSFGVGGTNAHVVLEEAPGEAAAPVRAKTPQLIVLSARSLRALEDATEQLARHLRAHPDLPLDDVAFTLQQGRHAFAFRRFVVARNTAEAGRWLMRRDRRHVFTTPARGVAKTPTSESDPLAMLGQRWIAGQDIDFAPLHRSATPRTVSLPTYPFQRECYWADPHRTSTAPTPAAPAPQPLQPEDTFAALKAELAQLSGVDLHSATAETALVDLGFDSLFLTQIAITLQKKFGVRLRFRQFLDELATLGALAAYLREHQQPVQPTPAASVAAAAPPAKPAAHGPFRRIDTSAPSELTAAQQRDLDDLIARYTQRTPGSKRFTAENRTRFADPRAVSGFRRVWKEMVYPLVADRSQGSKLWDIDGNEYTDITLGFGQILLGHRPPFFVEAIEQQLHRGIEIGPTSPLAGDVAALVSELTGMERVGFCNTGSEAVMAAIRTSRTVSGRDKIAVFAGAYHGIFDEVLIRPGGTYGAAAAIAPGIPEAAISNVFVLEYGEASALDFIRQHAHEIAAVLVEPVQSRRPDLQPREFLHELRRVTAEREIALVFDEVVTGFRCHPGGAQAHFGIRADLATYGKVVGGGMPIGIVAGSPKYMDALDGGAWNFGDDSVPEVGVTFFAGTFVRHPLALAAAKAILAHLKAAGPSLQRDLDAQAERFVGQLNDVLAEHEAPLRWTRFSSMFHLPPPTELKFAGTLWTHLRLRGVHAWEGRPNFISTAHTAQDFAHVLGAFRESVAEVVRAGFIPRATASRPVDPNVFPLTEAQQEIRLAAELGGDSSAAYNESVTIRFRGALDIAALQNALNTLVERHEALRTTIDRETQRVHPPALLQLAPTSGDPATVIQAETATPFDLEHGPLLRAVLLKLGETEHLLVLTVHHIVCDGWSFGTLAAELAALYSQRALSPAVPFREYISWLATQPLADTERYWRQRFVTIPSALDLPTDRPRPAQRTFRADRRITTLTSELIGSLQRVSAAQRCTLFTTMLGAFHALLHRLSGQDEIVVGIAAAGQAAMGSDTVVGHCLNFLPIRAALDDAQPFDAFLAALKGDVLDAFDHQHFTLGALLQKLSLPRVPSRAPLTAVTFNIDRAATGLSFAGLEAEFDINAKSRLGFELSFNLLETDHGWQLYCAFNADLFDGTTIERWLAHYRTLLEAITSDVSTPVGQLPLLDDASRRQLIEWSAGPRNPYPEDRPIHELFAEVAARKPDAIAYEGEQTLTYGELERRADRVANHLIAKGLRPGGIVALHGERSGRFLWEAIGTLRAGGAYLPLSPDEPAARRQIIEGKADISLSDPTAYENASDAPLKLAVDPTGPAYLLFTSGSTGTPKGVLVPHRAIARLVCNTDYAQLREDDVVSHQSNLSFDAATFEIWGALLNGGRLALTTTAQLLDSTALAEHYRAKGTTAAFVTAALFNRLVREQPEIFRPFRHLMFGGERCDPVAVEIALTKSQPKHLINGYGPTETTTFAVCHHVKRVENNMVPIGKPIANTDVFLLDPALQIVPIGVVGEIYIGGPGLAIGYDDPALTAQRFIETPLGRLYKTGDRARWLADGTIDILGRVDRQVKLRGFRIEPGEIEAALRAIPGVGECVVTLRDEVLVAYLTANSTEPPPAAELREQLSRSLPPWMLPSAFVRLPQMPLTPNGKIDLRQLPAPQDDAAPRRDGRPETTLHIELIALWQRTLSRQAIGIHDDFFSLGGHSLLAAQMLSTVEQQFGVRVPFSAMFEKATIAHLAAVLVDNRRRTAGESPLVPLQTSGTKTPLFFLHGDFSGGGFFCRNLARHLGADRPFYALHPHGLHGEQPPATIEAMAADRLNEVRRKQPSGPYLLGGFCNGALVAFEMARQLTAAGESVEAVIMVGADGANFRYRHVDRFARSLSQFAGDDETSRAQRFLAWREKAQSAEKWGRSQMMRLRAATSDLGHVPRRITQLLRARPSEPGMLAAPTLAPAHEAAANPAVVDAYNKAIDAYIPAPYGGRIILIWSNDDPIPEGGIAYGWESVCRDVQVIMAPGDHQSTVALDENLRELAIRLLPALERIEHRP